MIERTKKYECRANRALESGLFTLPNDSNAEAGSKKYLWVNETYERNVRARVFDLQGEQDCGELNLRDLLMHATRRSIAGKISRRIIIVEGMSRRYAEILGVRLDIPPDFSLHIA
jgi:hypothetical protein